MPSVIHMLSLAVIAAIASGAIAVFYAVNNVEPLHENIDRRDDGRRRRNRQRNDEAQLVIQERLDEVNNPNERDDNNRVPRCQLCGRHIVSVEYDLSRLRCEHEFHCSCISDYFYQTARNNQNQVPESTCPSCDAPYVMSDIE